MEWYNKPSSFEGDASKLKLQVPGKTDYWRTTLHGFIKDDAPFYYRKVKGDFEATVKFSASYTTLYDQAGIMVREDENTWMKSGVEYYHEQQHASTVITREFSDWSISPISDNPGSVWIKAKRTGECIETFYSVNGEDYTQIRQGYLSTAEILQVGLMAAAPTGDGFEVLYEHFQIVEN